jgi:hypothetical protein
MYSPFEEMTWPQFVSQPHLKKLSLQEQADLYNQYMFEISTYQQNWISYQNKGLPPSGNATPTGSIPSIISYFNYAGFYNETTSVNWTSYSASQAKCAFIDVSTTPTTVTGSTTYPLIAGTGVRSYVTPAVGVTLYDFYNPSLPYEPAGANQTASIISGLYGEPNTSVYTLFQGVITNIELLEDLPACSPIYSTILYYQGQSSSISPVVNFITQPSVQAAKCAYYGIATTPPSGGYPTASSLTIYHFEPLFVVGTTAYASSSLPPVPANLQNGYYILVSGQFPEVVAAGVVTINNDQATNIVVFGALPACS